MLLSIAIPTYNRANNLKKLLGEILAYIEEKKINEEVQVCVSNNASTDNTRQIVEQFKNKYPGLIKYNENEKNLGYDKNFIKVVEMSNGKFIWTMGDDDFIVEDGIAKVINFIKENCNEDTGVITFAHKSFTIDFKTGQKIDYLNTVVEGMPKKYEIKIEDDIGIRLNNTFTSVLVFNSHFFKKILEEEQILIKKAVGYYYIHTFIYQLMLLKYRHLKFLRFNEDIINVDVHYYKIYLEDEFRVFYQARKELNQLLLYSSDIDEQCKKILVLQQKKLKKDILKSLALKRAFLKINYVSFFDCVKMFFKGTFLSDALLFTIEFLVLPIIPPFILRGLYKIFLKIKYGKKWEKFWLHALITNSEMARGERRLIC